MPSRKSRARSISRLFGIGVLDDTQTTVRVGSAVVAADSDRGTTTISSALTSSGTSISSLSDVNLTVEPETLEIQAVADGIGQGAPWLWTWTASALPYARIPITNSQQTNVPLYKKGTYTINNYAGYDSDAAPTNAILGDSATQIHKLYLKWIDGAGTDNLVSWVTYDSAYDRISTINNDTQTRVQRLTISVPDSDTFTLPTLTAPSVSYNVTDSAGKYVFSGSAHGSNPNLGPWRRGGTYTLSVSATGHPLYLTTDNGTNFSSGSYFGEYTTGVTGSRSTSGDLQITVDSSAPDTLYYQCGNHSAMRGEITIKDLEVERNSLGRYVLYLQHTQEGMKNTAEIRPVPTLSDQMCIVYDANTNKFVPQDLATYVERTPSFKSKIQEVAGTATLVDANGEAVVASVEVVNDASYLPLSNNDIGDLVYATDTETIYVWDGTQWQQNTAGIDSDGIAAFVDSDYVSLRTPPAPSGQLSVALSQPGELQVITGESRWYAPGAITISGITARLGTAANATVTAVIKKNGSTQSTININSGVTSTTASGFTMADGDYLTLDVTAIGTGGFKGKDLYILFKYTLD